MGQIISTPIKRKENRDISFNSSGVSSFYQLPSFDGYYPMVGVWVIGGEAAGICLREDREIVTQDLSRFLPHYFT